MSIPNTFHFIWMGGRPLNIVHYLAIKSAIEVNRPTHVSFYCDAIPTGFWFERIKAQVDVIHRPLPKTVFGRPLAFPEHGVDQLKYDILLARGGIYLDLDTICKKPFAELLDNPCVLGWEGTGGELPGLRGCCNGVVLAEKGSEFLRMWQDSYRFYSGQWDVHSVLVPAILASLHPDQLKMMPPTSFHYPLWNQINLLFVENHDYPDAYCHHLWNKKSAGHIERLTEEAIKRQDTTYNVIARRYL